MRSRSPARSLLACVFAVTTLLAALLAFPRTAHAAGTFKLKSTEVNEVSGKWHIFATIELPKAPLTPHQSMRFLFTKTMVYERALVDGQSEPVVNRQALSNQTPHVESIDVGFGDPSGKIFKGTRFDFDVTRARDFEAGEYKVELRTSDGVTIGSAQNLILKGDNPVVDRRSIAFNAKEPGIKKVAGYDAGASAAPGADAPAAAPGGNGEVTPTGSAQPFVPREGYDKTQEEEIKTRPKGCGCSTPGISTHGRALLGVLVAALAIVAARRRAR